MARYIDADLAIDEIIKDMCGIPDVDEGIHTAISELRLMPTADVKPVERGEWEVIDEEEPRRYGCSICHCLSWDGWSNYCPNCGSRMVGE